MRLFVAVDVDRTTRDAARRLRDGLARAAPASERAMRWVHTDLLHLTVRFIGDVDQVAAVEALVERPLAQPRFTVAWGRPGWLPPRGRPRVFQVPIVAGASQLAALAGEIDARLTAVGLSGADRAFVPHLTLARLRDGSDADLSRTVDAVVGGDPFSAGDVVPVDEIVLYESHLSSHGPTYVARVRSRLP